MFLSVGQYTKAEEYLQKALLIRKEIGDKEGEASSYGNLGTVFSSVGQYTKAEEYLQKALLIKKEIGDKKGEASSYGNLGTVFSSVGQYTKAEEPCPALAMKSRVSSLLTQFHTSQRCTSVEKSDKVRMSYFSLVTKPLSFFT